MRSRKLEKSLTFNYSYKLLQAFICKSLISRVKVPNRTKMLKAEWLYSKIQGKEACNASSPCQLTALLSCLEGKLSRQTENLPRRSQSDSSGRENGSPSHITCIQ